MIFVVVLPSSTYLFTAGVEGFYFHLITLRHTPQSVGLLWTRDRPVARFLPDNTNTHTRQTSMLRWDSNPRSQQALGRKPTPQTALFYDITYQYCASS
jgi:hypothetical protein